MMSAAVWFAVVAHLLTTFTALLLLRRGANWRFRLLTLIVGLMALSQTIILLGSKGVWLIPTKYYAADMIELVVAASCLAAVYFLRNEIRDRRRTDTRLRLAESEVSVFDSSSQFNLASASVGRD
jgi:hypothetical protein